MNTAPAAILAAKPSLLAGVLQFVEAPAQAIVASLVPHASPAAQPAVANAVADPTEENLDAAAEAVLDPLVKTAVDAIAHDIPILGPIFEGTAENMAVDAEHAAVAESVHAGHVALAAIISRLQSFLPKPAHSTVG